MGDTGEPGPRTPRRSSAPAETEPDASPERRRLPGHGRGGPAVRACRPEPGAGTGGVKRGCGQGQRIGPCREGKTAVALLMTRVGRKRAQPSPVGPGCPGEHENIYAARFLWWFGQHASRRVAGQHAGVECGQQRVPVYQVRAARLMRMAPPHAAGCAPMRLRVASPAGGGDDVGWRAARRGRFGQRRGLRHHCAPVPTTRRNRAGRGCELGGRRSMPMSPRWGAGAGCGTEQVRRSAAILRSCASAYAEGPGSAWAALSRRGGRQTQSPGVPPQRRRSPSRAGRW